MTYIMGRYIDLTRDKKSLKGIKPLQGNILDALAWQILELKELEGATYQIKDNELFKLEVINGELK